METCTEQTTKRMTSHYSPWPQETQRQTQHHQNQLHGQKKHNDRESVHCPTSSTEHFDHRANGEDSDAAAQHRQCARGGTGIHRSTFKRTSRTRSQGATHRTNARRTRGEKLPQRSRGIQSATLGTVMQSDATTRTRTRRKRAALFSPLTARGVTAGRNGAMRHSPLTAIGVTAERLSDAAAVHNR